MIPELSDMAGVLTVVAYLMGMGAMTGLAWVLTRRAGEGRAGVVVLTVVFVLYLVGIALDAVPSVVTVLTNGVDDIPPSGSVRTGLFASWMWIVYGVMLARYRRTP